MSMISKREKEIIIRCAEKYKISSIYLFGSSLEYNDIDLAVKEIKCPKALTNKISYVKKQVVEVLLFRVK